MTYVTTIDQLRKGNDQVLSAFYVTHKKEFLLFAKKYFFLNELNAIDIYHDAFYEMLKNLRTGKLVALNCKPETYLFAIGRNLILKDFRRRGQFYPERERLSLEDLEPLDFAEEENENDRRITIVNDLIRTMKELCKRILTMFYYDKMKYDDMLPFFPEYNSIDSLKTTKFRCMKQFEKNLLEQI